MKKLIFAAFLTLVLAVAAFTLGGATKAQASGSCPTGYFCFQPNPEVLGNCACNNGSCITRMSCGEVQ